MDKRHGLVLNWWVTHGYGKRHAAQEMAAECPDAHHKTIGADKNDDIKGFVAEMQRLGVIST